jgi:pyochelin biosynthetic protein PchC
LTRDDLAAWQVYQGEFELTEFSGGHFYLTDQISAVAESISKSLQRLRAEPIAETENEK